MRHSVIAALLVIGLVPICFVQAARADGPEPGQPGTPRANQPRGATASITSGPNGVVVVIQTQNTQPGHPATNLLNTQSNSPGSNPSNCSAEPVNIGIASAAGWFGTQAPQHPGQVPFALTCDGTFDGIVWLPTGTNPNNVQVRNTPGAPVDPRTVALMLVHEIQLPGIGVGVNPKTGLVAMPAWFWVDGYDGSPITASDTLGSLTVNVQIAPTSLQWSFGDGGTFQTTSLGRPYPQESDIRHTYEQSSLGAGGAFSVSVTMNFSAQFRANGGVWQPLDPLSRSFTTTYPVQQLQSVLTGP
jgi:hypothetical protein